MHQRIRSDKFLSNVVKLVGWTVVAQAIYMIAMPILSRIFSVDAFGHLSVIQSIGSFFIVVSGLKYEVALLLPEDDGDAINIIALTALILVVLVLITLICGLAGAFARFQGSQLVFLSGIWWLIPLYQFGGTLNELLTNWAIRRKEFGIIARTKVAQSLSMLTTQLGLGAFGIGPIALYLGDVIGRMAGTTTLLAMLLRNDSALLKKVRISRMAANAKRYKSFPLLSSWAGLISVAARQLPVVLILTLCGATPAGAFGLATRVLASPLELVSRSFTQVYLGEGAVLARENPEKLRRLFFLSARRLLTIAVVPALIVALFGPALFSLVFGAKWFEAGIYARYLSMMLLVNVVTFSLAHTLNILERQSWQLAWDFATFAMSAGGIVLMHYLGYSARTVVFCYAVSMMVMHLLNIALCVLALNLRIRQHHCQEQPC